MPETPGKRQIDIDKDGRQQHDSAAANTGAYRSRSLQAGGEFLKALASDLATVANRLGRLLTAKRRRTRPSAPHPAALGPIIEWTLWRFSIALFGLLSICAGALSAVTLWVLFGFPPEPHTGDANTLASQFEARKSESPGAVGPLKVTQASRPDLGRKPEAPDRSEAKVMPSIAPTGPSPSTQSSSDVASADRWSRAPNCSDQPGDGPHRLCESGSSSSEAATMKTATIQQQTETALRANQPETGGAELQDRRPAARQRERSTALPDLRPTAQCNADACAATYKSFHAADCTYQPYDGGQRRLCELTTRAEEVRRQTSHEVTDTDEAKPARSAERAEAEEVPKAATPGRAAVQCKIDLCAATYASFHAADCTYQPHGGPRRLCER